MVLRIFFSLAAIPLLVTSCNMTFEVGLEANPTPIPLTTATTPAQDERRTPTTSEALPLNTMMPTDTPTTISTATQEAPTYTPSPTPLPGVEVIPLSSMGRNIPWLPLDKSRYPTVHVITFNTKLPPFDNPLVRKAFAAAIDKEAIAEMAKSYYEVDPAPATTFIPPQTLGRDLYGVVGIKFDPAYAKELLTQAGYQDGSTFPKVTFIVNSYGDTAPGARFNMAKAMADMWQTNLGVTVEVQAYRPPTFGDLIRSDPPALFWVGWMPDPGNDPVFIGDTYHSGSEYNYGYFSSAEFDTLVDQAAASHDPATRQALYIEAERVLCETEAGIIPLYHPFSNKP